MKPAEVRCKRTTRRKTYDDNIWQTDDIKPRRKSPDPHVQVCIYSCEKCYRVFKNKGKLQQHQKVCLKTEKGESFLKFVNLNKTYDTSGKILPTPLSQEHAQTSENPLTKIPTQVPEVYVMSISSNINHH